MSKEVWCEAGGGYPRHPRHLIARDDEYGDAESLAEESGAWCHGGDEGSGDWFCAESVDSMRPTNAEMAQYRREVARAEYEDAQDDVLSRADTIYDRMRENG